METKTFAAPLVILIISILTIVIGASMFGSSAEDLVKANHAIDELNGTVTLDNGEVVTLPTTGWVSAKLGDKAIVSFPTLLVLFGIIGMIVSLVFGVYLAVKK